MEKTYCNICGREFDIFDTQEGFEILSPEIGYGSKHDGCRLKLNICIDCMDDIIDRCKITPVTDLG